MTAADDARSNLMHTLAEAMGETVTTSHADPDRLVSLLERALREGRDLRHELTTKPPEEPDSMKPNHDPRVRLWANGWSPIDEHGQIIVDAATDVPVTFATHDEAVAWCDENPHPPRPPRPSSITRVDDDRSKREYRGGGEHGEA